MLLDMDTANELVEEFSWGARQGDTITINGAEYVFVGIEENIEDHRWHDTALLVMQVDGWECGLKFDRPSTEMQEDSDNFPYSYPPKLIPVKVETVERWVPA